MFDYPTISAIRNYIEASMGTTSDPLQSGGTPSGGGTFHQRIRHILEIEEDGADLHGLTSAESIAAVSKLSDSFGMDLPSTLLFDYPSIESLVDAMDLYVARACVAC